jgi:excisionase family DNA binding protein
MTPIEWETTAQVAERTNRHEVTVRRAVNSGKLHGHQTGPGGRWQFNPLAVDAWVEKRDSMVACGCQQLRLVQQRRRAS